MAKYERFVGSQRMQVTAGPATCSDNVLEAMKRGALAPVDREALRLFDETREFLKEVFVTKNEYTFFQQTSGTGGLETVIVNLMEPGEKLVVAITGVWGERIADLAVSHGVETVRITTELGQIHQLDAIEAALKQHRPKMLFITHGESSTGTLQPLEGIAKICQKYDCLFAVDVVITLCTEKLLTDEWELDVAVAASQKGVGAPTGLALITLSPKAVKIMKNRKSRVPFYYNIEGLAFNWNCSNNWGYFYTFSMQLVAAMHEALREKLEEGMENVWKRHKEVAEYAWSELEKIGSTNVIANPKNRLHSVCVYSIPKGLEWRPVVEWIYDNSDISVGWGIGPTHGMGLRMGIMGTVTAHKHVVDHLVQVLKAAFAHHKTNPAKESTYKCGIFTLATRT